MKNKFKLGLPVLAFAFASALLATSNFAAAKPAPSKSKPAFALTVRSPSQIDFQYTDGLFGSYRLVMTAKTVHLAAGPRVVSFDIKKCNQKLIDVYIGRVKKSLGELKPVVRENPENRVVMNNKIYRVLLASPAAPMLRNLPSETFYLSRLQADLCKKGRVPSSDGDPVVTDAMGVMTKLDQINTQLGQMPSMESTKDCPRCKWNELLTRNDVSEELHSCVASICAGDKSAGLDDPSMAEASFDKLMVDSPALKEFDKDFGPMFGTTTEDEYARGQCKASYVMALDSALTPDQLAKAKTTEVEVRTGLATNVFSKMSKETNQRLIATMKSDWEVKYPETPSVAKASFVKGLRIAAVSVKPVDLVNFCVGKALVFNDLELSNAEMANSNMTAPAMAHFFGHKVAAFLKENGASEESRGKFVEARKCLALKHKSEGRSRLTRVGRLSVPETDFTEEDFADQIAHMAVPKSKVNTACRNFTGEDSEYEMYSGEGELHSTPLFRLLFSEHARAGGLSESCKKLLKAANADIDFAPCM
jgi:hypothetical protein